jgi:restriction endonuclease S subunit
MLDEGGTCGIVLPEGFFFQTGKQLVELRKKLVEDFNVKYIVDIPQGVFENTSTKTCLMIFSKEGKTSEVEFIDFMKRNEEKRTLISASIDELKVKDYSFNFKKYVKQVWNLDDGYVLKKLGDIVEFVNGKTHKTSEASIHGKYPLFSSSLELAYFMDSFDYNRQCLIVNTINAVGNCNIHISECFSRTSNTMAFTSNTDKVLNKYLYYVLKGNLQLLKNCFTGTTKKKFNKSDLVEIEIPVPSISRQREIVEEIDNYAVRASSMKGILKDVEKGLTLQAKRLLIEEQSTIYKFKDVVTFLKKSKRPAAEGAAHGNYPFYTCSDTVKRCDVADHNDECILIGSGGLPSIHIDSQFSCSTDTFVVQSNIDIAHNYWIYFVLKGNMTVLEDGFTGTTIKHLSKSHLKDIDIPIPAKHVQEQLSFDYQCLRNIKQMITVWDNQAKRMISDLV